MKTRFASIVAAAVLVLSGNAGAQASKNSVKLVLLGQSLIEHDPRGMLDAPIASILPILARADVVFTNFEGAVTTPGCACTPTRPGRVFQHEAVPEIFDFLKFAHVNLLSLANNHSWDFGTGGVVSTLGEAKKRGLAVAGTGHNIDEAMKPAIVTVHGIRIAMLAIATVRMSDSSMATGTIPGVNLLRIDNKDDWARNIAAIKSAKKNADVVIVYQHFQTVGTPEWQHSWAHAAIDAGGTIYVAHGDPHLAGVESYKGKPILYGLGNFIFQTHTEPGYYGNDVWESVIVELTVGKNDVSSVKMTPIVLKEGVAGPNMLATRGFPVLASTEASKPILERLAKLSSDLGAKLVVDSASATLPIAR
jgi:poly-gamma-glutamate synthesis protein (capsule biosynthesis protein)